MGAIIGRVQHHGVFSYAQFVQCVEQHTHVPIVQDHGVVVETLTADAFGFFRYTGPDMHVG